MNKDDPSILAWLCCGYAAVQLVGMSVFGIERWSRRADAFGVYYGLYARMSPLTRQGRTLMARRPLSGLTQLDVVPGTIGLLCVAIGSTTFDGGSQGPLWNSIAPHLQKFFSHLGLGLASSGEAAGTVGLIAAVLVVSALYWAGVTGMRTVDEGFSRKDLARRFAHSLVPIAFAYALAHYFSLLVYQGQAVAYLISDPLGTGSNLFGTATATIDYGVISSTGVWYVQVVALVTGHVCGLMLAHDRALVVYRKAREAMRSQYWMLVVMVGFTSLGLWLLSSAKQ